MNKGNIILYETVIAVGLVLGVVTLATKSSIGIVVLILLFIIMSCAEIYWWSKYQEVVDESGSLKQIDDCQLADQWGFR